MPSATTTRIYELQVKLATESLRSLKTIEKSAKDASKQLDVLTEGFKGLASGIAAGLTVHAFVEGVRAAIDSVDELGAASERIGVSVETFSALAFAANQSDVEIQALEQGMIKLEKAMTDTASEGGKVLKALEVDPNQDPTKVLEDFATALQNIKDPAQQTGALLAVFGKSGAQLKPLLDQGGEGIRALIEEAQKLGLVISTETADKISDLDNNFKKIDASSKAAWIQIASGMTPALTNISSAFIEAASHADTFRASGEGVGNLLVVLAKAAAILGTGFNDLIIDIAAVAAEANALIHLDFAAYRAIDAAATEDQTRQNDELTKTLALLSGETKKAADEQKSSNEQTEEAIRKAKQLKDELDKADKDKKAAVETERAWNKEKELAAALIKKTATDLETYNEAEATAIRLKKEGLLTQQQYNQAIEDAEDAYEKARVASEKVKKEDQDILDLVKSLRTAQEIYTEELAKADKQLADHVITQDTYDRQLSKITDDLRTAQEETDKAAGALTGVDLAIDNIANNLPKYGGQLSETLVDFATNADGAASSFADMTISILRDIATMVTQILVIQPLIEAFKASIQSSTAGGGGIGGLFSSLFSSANGNAFMGGSPMQFANGGVFSGPVLFPMGNGKTGSAAEGGPFSEAIMPLARDKNGRLGVSGSGGGVTVNVINNAGADVQVEQQTGPSGEQFIQVMIERAVETAIGKGKFDNTLQTMYGLNRRGR